MSHFHQPTSTWIQSLDRQLVRAKHVLLHGNTSDLALYSGMLTGLPAAPSCSTFEDALHRYLVDLKFSLVVHYNVADGLRLARPEMDAEFDRACAAGLDAAPGQSFVNQLGVSGNPAGAVEMLRRLLQQEAVRCAVVMHFADKLVGEHQSPEELQILVRLKHAMQIAAFAREQTSLRNTFIGVASDLRAVPAWLYVNNPRVALVPVARPNAPERRHWIGTRLDEFHGASAIDDKRRQDLVRELADRTEGMTLFDIALLPRVSRAEEIPLGEPHALVRAARFGKKEDPWRELDRKRLESADSFLGTRVKGQLSAINAVVSTLRQAYVGIGLGSIRAHGGPPKGVFFFVGPTGVGKTELAKSIAELVFGDDDRMKVFDMGEFQQEQAGDRLAGSPTGYVGSERGGELTNHVQSEPFSVILFDEIDKAHPSVNDKFLGILEEGRLTDGRGMTAYFDQTVLVFTSNIGSDQLMSRLRSDEGSQPSYEELRSLYKRAVEEHFTKRFGRPELLGRFGDNVIVFDMLRPDLVRQLCDKFLGELRDNVRRQHQIELTFDDSSINVYLARRMREPENLTLGGRRVRELIKTAVVLPLSDFIFTNKCTVGIRLHLSIPSNAERIDIVRQSTH